MAESKQELKAVLADARAHLNRVLDAAADRVDTQVYSDGLQWNVRQVAVHIADADRGHNGQVMGFVEGREVIPADFDIERYNKRVTEKRAEMTYAEARTQLNDNRAALNAWLEGLDDATLDNVGRHASLRMMSVREVLTHMAAHERQHADDIAAVLKMTS